MADPRLEAVYGTARPGPPVLFPDDSGTTSLPSTIGAPSIEQVVDAELAGTPLSGPTWMGFNYRRVDADALTARGIDLSTDAPVLSLFVVGATPFSAIDAETLERLAATSGVDDATVVGPSTTSDIDTLGVPEIGNVPWAPTDPGVRWSIALGAAGTALLAVFVVVAVAAIDRRAHNRRLLDLGATPTQIRAGAALDTLITLALTGVVTVGLTVALVGFGVDQFNDRRPDIAIPFVVPPTLVAFLVIGVPMIGASLAFAASIGASSRDQSEQVAPASAVGVPARP